MALGHYLLLLASIVPLSWSASYRATVVEYHQEHDTTKSGADNFQTNIQNYVDIIGNLAPQVDIVVFPEYGLTGLSPSLLTSVELPQSQDDQITDQYMQQLSKAASDKKTYVVVNVVEKYKGKQYNTDVVFAKNGSVVARYRKWNLYDEAGISKTEKPEIVSFVTDFNVEFGLITCFDILFQTPAMDLVNRNITNFIFPSAWFSELPFLTAIQYQKSWSRANEVTLLAANKNNPSDGSTGSGIYIGRSQAGFSYVQLKHNITATITVDLPINDQTPLDNNPNITIVKNYTVSPNMAAAGLNLKQEDMKIYKTAQLALPNQDCSVNIANGSMFKLVDYVTVVCTQTQKLCQDGLCCNFNVTTEHVIIDAWKAKLATDIMATLFQEDSFSYFNYAFVVNKGFRNYGDNIPVRAMQEVCGLVPCVGKKCLSIPDVNLIQPVSVNITLDKKTMIMTWITEVSIEGNFNRNGLISPNIVFGHKSATGVNTSFFGALPNDNQVTFALDDSNKQTMVHVLVQDQFVLGSASIYNRIHQSDKISSASHLSITHILLLAAAVIAIQYK